MAEIETAERLAALSSMYAQQAASVESAESVLLWASKSQFVLLARRESHRAAA